MVTLTYKKTANIVWLGILAAALVMPDVVFGLVLELGHLALECAHLAFEVFEFWLDHLVEHLFHTETKETQIIVFYLIMAMASVGFFLLWRKAVKMLRNLKAAIHALWLANLCSLSGYWSESAHNKFKLIAGVNVALTVVYFVSF